jgi:mRNA-degrading endonuclease RelE of RelBE toxin-antitoxin system
MAEAFVVRTIPHFDRLAKGLQKLHPEFTAHYRDCIAILRDDPYNTAGRHAIKKLTNIPRGERQYRLRLRRWRFRYDIYDDTVLLAYCGLRDESTYR